MSSRTCPTCGRRECICVARPFEILGCPCGDPVILADTEDWAQPLCFDCWYAAIPSQEKHALARMLPRRRRSRT